MTFEEALRDELSSILEINNKVFPLNATGGTKAPYVIYISTEGLQDKSLQGYLNSKEIDCEINIIHSSYEKMKPLTRSVVEKIITFQGRSIGEFGPFIQNVSYEKPIELHEKEVSLYRCVIDFKFKF